MPKFAARHLPATQVTGLLSARRCLEALPPHSRSLRKLHPPVSRHFRKSEPACLRASTQRLHAQLVGKQRLSNRLQRPLPPPKLLRRSWICGRNTEWKTTTGLTTGKNPTPRPTFLPDMCYLASVASASMRLRSKTFVTCWSRCEQPNITAKKALRKIKAILNWARAMNYRPSTEDLCSLQGPLGVFMEGARKNAVLKENSARARQNQEPQA